MSPEDINKKAYEKYPVKMIPDDDTMGFTSTDVNEAARNGYIEAYKEISALPTIKGWVARNAEVEGGQINLFASKPRRKEVNADHYINRVWLSSNFRGHISLPDTLFPSLCWKDEPIEVELPIIRK